MKSLHTIQRARLFITMQKLIEASISRLTFILFRFHNYNTLPINQANLNHGFDRFTISRLFFEPVNFLLSGPPTSAPRRSTFQETIHPPRPLLDVPRDAPPAHPARTVTEVDLSSPPLQRGAHHRHPCAATRARTDAASPKNHAPIVPLIESQASACAPVASKNFTARPFNWSRRRARGGAEKPIVKHDFTRPSVLTRLFSNEDDERVALAVEISLEFALIDLLILFPIFRSKLFKCESSKFVVVEI